MKLGGGGGHNSVHSIPTRACMRTKQKHCGKWRLVHSALLFFESVVIHKNKVTAFVIQRSHIMLLVSLSCRPHTSLSHVRVHGGSIEGEL